MYNFGINSFRHYFVEFEMRMTSLEFRFYHLFNCVIMDKSFVHSHIHLLVHLFSVVCCHLMPGLRYWGKEMKKKDKAFIHIMLTFK